MLSNEYLYGTNKVPSIPKHIAEERISLLRANLLILLEVKYEDRDNARVNDVCNGIKFWNKLSKDK